VLGHLLEVGDHETQRALDAFLDQAADLLLGVDAAATDLATRLRTAARSGAEAEHRVAETIDADGSPGSGSATRPGPGLFR